MEHISKYKKYNINGHDVNYNIELDDLVNEINNLVDVINIQQKEIDELKVAVNGKRN